MKYMRSRSLKRLFSFGRRSFGHEEEDPASKDIKEVVSAPASGLLMQENKHLQQQQLETGLRFPVLSTLPKIEPFNSEDIRPPTFKCFSFAEISVATNGFSSENLVGKGGYAEVYKGVIISNNSEETSTRTMVAVKKLTKASSEEKREREFLCEIGTMGHVCHPNVSSLLGCCIDNGLYLIFQLSPRGSVASRLHDESSPALEWSIRYKIAVGTAKGLNYLHQGCKRRIIHRDIKASNVLLNHDFEPLISDFGLAKWLPTQWSHHSIAPIEGTVGYLAPEYFSHGIVDEKTDVFAFGVFLLELISGKKPVDSSHQNLRTWAKPYLKQQGEISKLVDTKLGSDYVHSELKRITFAASLCIRASSAWRPTMAQVLEIMTGDDDEITDKERWEMPEEGEKQEDLWGFEDLESDYYGDGDVDVDDETGSSFTSTSVHDEDDTVSSGASGGVTSS